MISLRKIMCIALLPLLTAGAYLIYTHDLSFTNTISKKPGPQKKKVYTQEFGKGVRFFPRADQHLPFISFDHCFMEKKSVGGFSFGGINVLVIRGLEINIQEWSDQLSDFVYNKKTDTSTATQPSSNKGYKQLVYQQIYQALGTHAHFSNIRIEKLRVYTGKDIDQRTLLLSSDLAKGDPKKGLSLARCHFRNESGNVIYANDATMSLSRPLCVTGGGQVVNLEQVLRSLNEQPKEIE